MIAHRTGETRADVVMLTPKTLGGIDNYRKGRRLYANY